MTGAKSGLIGVIAGERPTVWQATLDVLREFGMTTVFGNPGSTELPFLRDWPDDFRYVLGLQEASVVGMADGYSQAARVPVLVNLHATAGVGNSLGNLFTAYRNRTPLVVLAGQQPRFMLPGRPYLAGEAPRDFPKPYVKWSVEPARAEDVPETVAQAIRIAMQPPCGPTFVSVPADDWDAIATPVAKHQVLAGFVAPPEGLQVVADALNTATRPALIVGPAVDREEVWDELVALAERLNANVWISPLASRAGFPEDHRLFAGFLAPMRQRIAEVLAGYDVAVVIGAPLFTYHLPSNGELEPSGMRLFHLTDDPAEAASAGAGTTLLTTVRPAVTGLLGLIPQSSRPAPTGRDPAPRVSSGDPLPAEYVLDVLGRRLPQDAVIVEEAPSHHMALQRHIPIRTSGGYYTMASGGMGYGLPAAVGVALAAPARRVVAVIGDGASQYCIQALWNAAQLALPITFVILNNGGYAALKMLGRSRYDRSPPGVDLPGIDIVALANAYGCGARRATEANGFSDALEVALATPGPYLLDVIVAAPHGLLY